MANSFDVDADLVRKLADLLGETGLGEIEYEEGGKRIRVVRPNAAPAAIAPPAPAPVAPAIPAAAPADGDAVAAHPGAVTSPMVGTVYLSPGPGESPFVRAGEPVTAGQTLLLVEAMKTYNEIKAPQSGTLARFLVTDGQPVEFGEALAIIE